MVNSKYKKTALVQPRFMLLPNSHNCYSPLSVYYLTGFDLFTIYDSLFTEQ
jgi:hypothetical protein